MIAGEAGTGIGELISQALVKQAAEEGATLTLEEARQHCCFMDSQGVINATRSDTVSGKLAAHKVRQPCKTAPMSYRRFSCSLYCYKHVCLSCIACTPAATDLML